MMAKSTQIDEKYYKKGMYSNI